VRSGPRLAAANAFRRTHVGVSSLARRRAGHTGTAEQAVREGTSPPAVLHRDTLYRRMLAVADLLSAGVAVLLAIDVLGDDALSPAAVVPVLLVVLVGKVMGLYDRDQHLLHKTTLDEAPRLFNVATLYTLLIVVAQPLLVEGNLGRDQIAGLWGLLLLSLLMGRAFARFCVRASTAPERCLVIGEVSSAERARQKLDASHSIHATIVGRVPLEGSSNGASSNGASHNVASLNGDVAVLGSIEGLGRVLVEHDIHRAIVAPGPSDSDEILDVIRLVKSLGVKVSVLPRLFEVVGSSVEFDDIEGILLLGVRSYGLTNSSKFLKRTLDLAGSTFGLVLLAPLLLAISLAVKLTSPGPVLFRQKRIGREGREFEMLKFRTMVDGAEGRKSELVGLNEAADGLFKIADDPRLTPVGRFLRPAFLDEIPQLVNVLRGEMSLVGPRPLVPDEDRRIEGWQRRRLTLSPGMTGPWQIFGASRVPLREMVKIDYQYAANWSLWLDVQILMRTLPSVVKQRGL
jgi:exopolysaccharide biosynthesis polyprenyl glycosylphosphotransferase